MSSIGFVNGTIEKGYVGELRTLSIRVPLEIRPNRSKAGEVQSDLRVYSDDVDYRIVSRKNGFELGAGWVRTSQTTGVEYVSVSLSAPEFGTIYGNIANAPGDDPMKKVIIWNPPS